MIDLNQRRLIYAAVGATVLIVLYAWASAGPSSAASKPAPIAERPFKCPPPAPCTDSSPHGRLVFIDGGANNGNSYAHFLDRKNSGNPWAIPAETQAADFDAFLFEVNPVFDLVLKKKSLQNARLHVFPQTACWHTDTVLPIYLDTYAEQMSWWGSSVFEKGNNDYLKSKNKKIVNVTAVAMGDWLVATFTEADYVVVKLDIEGAEFVVLDNIIKAGACGVIDQLLVEFHDQYNDQQSPENQKNRIIQRLKDCGHNIDASYHSST